MTIVCAVTQALCQSDSDSNACVRPPTPFSTALPMHVWVHLYVEVCADVPVC